MAARAVVSATTADIVADLSWMDMLRGIAIIGVFVDNWNHYIKLRTTPPLLHTFANTFVSLMSPAVQLFFILSGLGLTVQYLSSKGNWSWKHWAWRRITKVIVPYEIAVIISFALGLIGSRLYPSIETQFSWKALLAYVTLTRNLFPSVWVWNPPFWFMPAIVGLYSIFPVLIYVLQRCGLPVLLLVSVLATLVTATLAVIAGTYESHGADVFPVWTAQFSLGIALGHIRHRTPEKMRYLLGGRVLLLGIGLVALSWVLRTWVPLGVVYNDLFTSMGIFLVVLNVGWLARRWVPAVGTVLNALARKSYLMFLVHYPIMSFLIGPPLRANLHPLIVLALGGVYLGAVFILASLISGPLDKLTAELYSLLCHPYQPAVQKQ